MAPSTMTYEISASPVDEHLLAKWLCAARNAEPSPQHGVIVVTFRCTTESRRDRDEVLRLCDRSCMHIYPQVDPREIVVSVAAGRCAVELTFAPTGPIRIADGTCYVMVCDGPTELKAASELYAARKQLFASRKANIKLARAAITEFTRRASRTKEAKVFVSGSGVAFVGVVAGCCEYYAYIALPLDGSSEHWRIVAKISKPRVNSKSFNLHQLPAWHAVRSITDIQALKFAKSPKFAPDVSSGFLARFVSHRLRLLQHNGQWQGDFLELDDCALTEPLCEVLTDEVARTPWTSVTSTVDMIAGDMDLPPCDDETVSSLVEQLQCNLMDPFRQPQHVYRSLRRERDSICPFTAAVEGAVVPFEECSTIEFKYKVNIWDASSDASNPTQTSTERLRQAIAAMANTRGGVIFVGVDDDGVIRGAQPIRKHLRLDRFAPEMHSDALSLTELPLGSAQVSLAHKWWKAGGPAATDQQGSNVVTVIRVMQSVAPYHLTGPFVNTAPMARGAASTIPLSVSTMVSRLCAELERRQGLKRPLDDSTRP